MTPPSGPGARPAPSAGGSTASGGAGGFATGLDRLLAHLARAEGPTGSAVPGPYALLAHHASVTAGLVPAHLALAASPAGAPAVLLGPEHGYYGVEQDMVPAAPGRDPWSGARIVSLYGDSEGSLRPDPAVFDGVELLIVDLQDVGARYYTYAASAVWAARVALAAGVEVWVLDRPNPLGGTVIEGNLLGAGYESFVGAFRIPVRHGLTLGELVRLELGRDGDGRPGAPPAIGADGLTVWPMAGWSREMAWQATSRPWIAPSPNMPTAETALLYPGGCLIEATRISEGRGTTRPFHLVGAPGIDPPALARMFAERLAGAAAEPAGVAAVPTYFRPQFQKHAGALCGGVELVVTDAERFRPVRAGVELLAALAEVAPDAFAWRDEPYEFVHDRPAIDLLAGTDALRTALDAGPGRERGLDEWLATWPADEAAFRELRRPALLYPEPAPEIDSATGDGGRGITEGVR